MRGLSRTPVVREGILCTCCVLGEIAMAKLFRFTRKCQLCVTVYCAWGLCVHVGVQECWQFVLEESSISVCTHVLQHDNRGPVYYTQRRIVDIVKRTKRGRLAIPLSFKTMSVYSLVEAKTRNRENQGKSVFFLPTTSTIHHWEQRGVFRANLILDKYL